MALAKGFAWPKTKEIGEMSRSICILMDYKIIFIAGLDGLYQQQSRIHLKDKDSHSHLAGYLE